MKQNKKPPSTCLACRHATPVATRPGNPAVVHCRILNRRLVADSPRNCDRAE